MYSLRSDPILSYCQLRLSQGIWGNSCPERLLSESPGQDLCLSKRSAVSQVYLWILEIISYSNTGPDPQRLQSWLSSLTSKGRC